MPVHIYDHAKSQVSREDMARVQSPDAGALFLGASFSQSSGDLKIDALDFVAVELDMECLSAHIGLDPDPAYAHVVGFAQFRMGNAAPSLLIELVKQPWTKPEAIASAKKAFEEAGFIVATCNDMPGRIVNRLIRPYLNAVLRRLDGGLATAEHMDMTLRLGLGYPEGPIALLERTGLAHHYDVSKALYDALGDPDFAPARRACVAKARSAAS